MTTLADRATPVAFTLREGEYYYPWGRRRDVAERVAGGRWTHIDASRFHAIFFSDGSALDFINGWRPLVLDRETVTRICDVADENFLRDFPS
jgi:hypothetical protein